MDIGLLDDVVAWGYVVGVIAVAFAGKIIGGAVAARLCKFVWREGFTIGVLMSCKGLIELIVLNNAYWFGSWHFIPANLHHLVIMAVVTTVATTPLTHLLYPPWYQQKLGKWKRGEIDWNGDPKPGSGISVLLENISNFEMKSLLVQIRLDSLPAIFTLVTLLGKSAKAGDSTNGHENRSYEVVSHSAGQELVRYTELLKAHGLRMLELTQRESSVMRVAEQEHVQRDPIIGAFTTFTQLQSLTVSASLAVVPTSLYAETVISHARNVLSDVAIIPWGEYGNVSPVTSPTEPLIFPGLSAIRSSTVMGLFSRRRTRCTAYFSRSLAGSTTGAALGLTLQLARNPDVRVTIAHCAVKDVAASEGKADEGNANVGLEDAELLAALQVSLAVATKNRVSFTNAAVSRAEALEKARVHARICLCKHSRETNSLVIIGRRHPLFDAVESVSVQVDLKLAVGAVAEHVVKSDLQFKASALIVQPAAQTSDPRDNQLRGSREREEKKVCGCGTSTVDSIGHGQHFCLVG
ncbi:hypothetical protein SODALDRAFT_73898 [Sodiomyces alkalinus F11]|uniref:Cation/H+ exchanger transmembrane domain-containing protein n=1 Tax=Sodiomyces alkalinus (strain CBS 110278 / VKM F-3762 / F11) TaxID=1314773 RepID=A0A3N2PKJ4_SODAK|nr:hypothetical protein SODALDRAFT_73898 [Sodiomyces alkalinus F11]ROT34924.1 hypothetical protein SODALDRAFT_73898 [Sodiomyces alkalinus F11]